MVINYFFEVIFDYRYEPVLSTMLHGNLQYCENILGDFSTSSYRQTPCMTLLYMCGINTMLFHFKLLIYDTCIPVFFTLLYLS